MTHKVAYFTNIAPHYREKLWLNFAKSTKFEFHFFYGNSTKNGIREIDFNTENWKSHQKLTHQLKNIRIKGRLVFQLGVLKNIIFGEWNALIFLGDVNIISNWIGAIIGRIRGIPVMFWGHGLYDGDAKGLGKKLRLLFLSIADKNIVYGEWAKKQMIKNGFDKNSIKVIYNSLDYDETKKLRIHVIEEGFYSKNNFFKKPFPILLFIGRLTPQKKLEWLLDAVYNLSKNGIHYNLMIVGDGPEITKLKTLANDLNINVFFYGASYNEEMNAKIIANADLCVSPGNVGLTAIHSLSYGTPVCSNNDFKNQMPEFEAIEEGLTGCFFDWDKRNISETILKWFTENEDREKIRKNCYKIIDEKYNPYHQLKIMEEIIKNIKI